jgi:hypothetical protein
MTRHVYELPPRDSWSIRVSFESLYGICPPDLASVRALITLPRAERDLLIILASSSVWPEAWVLPTFSDPAKSQR